MQSMPLRLAFVSNSMAVATIVRDYATSRQLPMEIRLASMEEALPVAEALLQGGTDVILGGGGTGKNLRRHLNHPVVTVARTHFDILQALRQAREITDYIGCTSYGGTPPWIGLFAELLGVRLLPIPFTSTPELIAGISAAVSSGVGCIVGGGICVEIAKGQHCPGIVVTPGEEALERAFEEAVNIARSRHRDREHSAWVSGVLESLHEGIVGVDHSGKIATTNHAAELLLGDARDRDESLMLEHLGLNKAIADGMGEEGVVRSINGTDLIINTRPVMVDGCLSGAVAAFTPTERLNSLAGRIGRKRSRNLTARYRKGDLLGNSKSMQDLRQQITRFAGAQAALHINGESGTGKELVAHALHQESPRRHGPFVALNCGALPETLLESELFGYDEGAFTGARRGGKSGLFELANGGTIFLDEIADISPAVQVRLLRVLETGEIFRLGGDKPIVVNVRVVSSSWKDLVSEVRAGNFRADLYYRLSLLRLHTPPLRERPEDMAMLARHILEHLAMGHKQLSAEAVELLKGYAWPGNIRELGALLQRYCLLVEGDACDTGLLQTLLDELRLTQETLAPGAGTTVAIATEDTKLARLASEGTLRQRMEKLEQEIIRGELVKRGYNRQQVARALGVSACSLWRKMKNISTMA